MSDDMLMVFCGNEMPKVVNVFNAMTKQSQEKWISTVENFLFKMGQKFVIEELSKWGNAWKALLFNFLTHALAGMDDFTVVDSKGKRVAVKKQLLTLGVMVMSKIDLDVFLAAESEDAPHIDMSLSLIEQFCRFGGEENVRRVQSLVLYLITNQLRAACFDGKKANQNRAPSFDSIQWFHIERLVTIARRHIFEEDEGYAFTVHITNRTFPDEKLVGSMAKLFETKAMTGMLNEQSLDDMLEFKSSKKKKVITRRMEQLRILRNLFLSLQEFMKWVKSKLKAKEKTMKLEAEERRANQGKEYKAEKQSQGEDEKKGGLGLGLGQGAGASQGKGDTTEGEFNLNISNLSEATSEAPAWGDSVVGFGTDARGHEGVGHADADDMFAEGFNTFQTLSTLQDTNVDGIMSDAPECKLTLIMSLVELGYGDENEVLVALEYMVEKFLKSGNMAALQEFAQDVAEGGEEKTSRGTTNDDGIRYLSTQQEEQLNRQLSVKNRHKKARNIYKVQMFGATVAVKVLEADMLLGKVKLEVTLHQQLSVNPFVVQLYGVGFSPILGWYTAMEYVPFALTDKIFRKSAPLDLRNKFKLAIDITQGFDFLHSVGVFHRDIKPDNILITQGLGIRICDFGISEEMGAAGAHKTLKTLQYSAAIGTPMYMSPEQHIMGYTMDKLSADMSRKIDVYSLGIVLLEVFAGIPVLDNVLPRNPREGFLKLNETNPDPSTPAFDTKVFNDLIPLEVLTILRQAIAFSPTCRPFMSQLKNKLKKALLSLQKQGLVDTDEETERASEERSRANSTRMRDLLTGRLATLPRGNKYLGPDGKSGQVVPDEVDEYDLAANMMGLDEKASGEVVVDMNLDTGDLGAGNNTAADLGGSTATLDFSESALGGSSAGAGGPTYSTGGNSRPKGFNEL